MIYIKEMLFGNKQSRNEGRRQLGGALWGELFWPPGVKRPMNHGRRGLEGG